MIIVQTPLRISLSGGGTDLREYYKIDGGCVISTAIDKYTFVIVKERFDDKIYVDYSRKEIVDNVDDIQHGLVREALKITGIKSGIEICMLADIPSEGSGLGSSSSITVGLLNAFYHYQGQQIIPEQLAREACKIEIEYCGQPIGKQDQYIVAYGGIRQINFNSDETVTLQNLSLNASQKRVLCSNLLLFFTNKTRKSADILSEQKKHTKIKKNYLDKIKGLVKEVHQSLENNKFDKLGGFLDYNWQMKKELASKITNSEIDYMYDIAMKNGALGGKILGAGGGGFLLVYCPRANQNKLREALKDYREMPFMLERDGSKVIFNVRPYSWK